jgi:hypothetical protein
MIRRIFERGDVGFGSDAGRAAERRGQRFGHCLRLLTGDASAIQALDVVEPHEKPTSWRRS